MLGEHMRLRAGRDAPPARLCSPLVWGTEAGVRELLGPGISSLQTRVREVVFRYRSPEHMLEFQRAHFGPTRAAFDALDSAGQAQYADDFVRVAQKYNRADDGTLAAPSTYLEVTAVRVS